MKEYWKTWQQVLALILVAAAAVVGVTCRSLPPKKTTLKPLPPFPEISEAAKKRALAFPRATNDLVAAPVMKSGVLYWNKQQEVTIIEYSTNLNGPWRLLVATIETNYPVPLDKQQCFFRFYPQN